MTNVDPNLVAQAYKVMLTEANSQVALLQAAASQLQNELTEVKQQLAETKSKNQELMSATGRQDGVN